MGSTQDESAVAVLSAEALEDAAFGPATGALFVGLRVATGTRYIFQWYDTMNEVNYAETDTSGNSGWAQIVHASPPHPHNRTEGTRLRVHRCNLYPCPSHRQNTGFHVLEERVCEWCGSAGYDLGSFGPPHRHLVRHLGVLVLRWISGVLRCKGCVDLDEPPHFPNNRQRHAAWLLNNCVLPVAVRIGPVCALIAKCVAENLA